METLLSNCWFDRFEKNKENKCLSLHDTIRDGCICLASKREVRIERVTLVHGLAQVVSTIWLESYEHYISYVP
jgi:hypothetical protein